MHDGVLCVAILTAVVIVIFLCVVKIVSLSSLSLARARARSPCLSRSRARSRSCFRSRCAPRLRACALFLALSLSGLLALSFSLPLTPAGCLFLSLCSRSRSPHIVAGIMLAAVLVVLSVPRKPAAPGALLQDASVRHPVSKTRKVATMLLTQLKELKALPVVTSLTSIEQKRSNTKTPNSVGRQQLLAEVPVAQAAVAQPAANKPCDADCQQTKKAGRDRMKVLRSEIDSDFTGMIGFGDEAAYVPPVESIAKQVADGSLYKNPKDDIKAPSSRFGGSALINQDPGASVPVLQSGEVNEEVKDVATETPSADDLLKGIQDAEVQAQSSAPKVGAAAVTDEHDPILQHKSKSLPAGITFGNEVAAPAPSPSHVAPAPVAAAAPVATAAPAPAPEVSTEVKDVAAAPPSADDLLHGIQTAAAAEKQEQRTGRAAAPAVQPVAAAPPVAAPPAPAHPARAKGVLSNFPHVGPQFSDENNEAPSPSPAAEPEEKEWQKAFAFIHQTDNPVVGNNGQENTLEGGHLEGQGKEGVVAAVDSVSSPLDDDNFLKGFLGGK